MSNQTSPVVISNLLTGNQYYFAVTAVNTNGESAASTKASATPQAISSAITLGNGIIYHIATTGNDNSSGTNSQPFRTINKFISVAKAGDTAQIHAGTYVETTENNPYVAASFWFDGVRVSIGMRSSGTANNPITLMALPGDEGKVIINSNNQRLSIFTNGFDYWQLYGLRIENSLEFGIGSPSKANLTTPPTDDDLAIGWRIENCLIKGVTPTLQGNTAGIGMWASKDWIVRNNRITNIQNGVNGNGSVRYYSGIQAYSTINSLVENNYIEAGVGIFLKDHFIKSLSPRATYFEYEIRNNIFNVTSIGVTTTIKGSPNIESGSNYIHHNIMYGFNDTENANLAISGNPVYAGNTFRFEHNLVDMPTNLAASAVAVSDHNDTIIKGNIFTGGTVIYEMRGGSDTKTALTYSDYNLFSHISNFQMALDRYGNVPTKWINDFSWWQTLKLGDAFSLKLSNPDQHSKLVAASSLFQDKTNHDYHAKTGAPSLGVMSDGSNAGPYQNGNETIGLLSNYSAGQ